MLEILHLWSINQLDKPPQVTLVNLLGIKWVDGPHVCYHNFSTFIPLRDILV